MNIINIEDVVSKKKWQVLIANFLPVTVAVSYSFAQSMQIADCLIKSSVEVPDDNRFFSDVMRDYAVNLMIILREKFPEEWQEDWKNEAFLGITCRLVFRYEEAFKYISNAYHHLKDPPQSLILAYMNASSSPDIYLSKKELDKLFLDAAEKGITYEIALHMGSLAYQEGNSQNEEFWEQKALEAEKEGVHIPLIVPDVIMKQYDGKTQNPWGFPYEK